MLSAATLPMSLKPQPAMYANASPMHALGFSRWLVRSGGRRLSPALLTAGVSMVRRPLSVTPLTLRCSSVSSSSSFVDEAKEFVEASKKGNLIPFRQCIFSDQLAPLLACFVKEGDREDPGFLFESAEPNPDASSGGCYSIVGAEPTMEIMAKENKVTIMDHECRKLTEEIVDDPMAIPRRLSQG